jgi:hypothetical protein
MDYAGTELAFSGVATDLDGAVASTTIENLGDGPALYRAAARNAGDENGITYTLTANDASVVETVARNRDGEMLIGVRADGKLTFPSGIVPASTPGDAIDANTVPASALETDVLQTVDVTIAAADITSTSAGKLGHANGYPLVATPGADAALELLSAVLVYDYDTAQYGAGGNITVNWAAGGAALTGVVSAANSLGAAADKAVLFVPLSTAGIALVADKGLNLVAASAFTNPGTAAGVVRVRVTYRTHALGLA